MSNLVLIITITLSVIAAILGLLSSYRLASRRSRLIELHAAERALNEAVTNSKQFRKADAQRISTGLTNLVNQNINSSNVSFSSIGSRGDLVVLSSELEAAGNQASRSLTADDHQRSVFELRQELVDLGVWTPEDVVTFEQVLDRRNYLVHNRDGVASDDSDVLRKGSQLLRKTLNFGR